MKATTDAAGLHSLADWCARIAPARPSAPILSAVLLETGEDGLRATVTDYDQFGRADLAAVVDTDERLAVSARLLAGVAEAIGTKGNGRVELVAEGDGKLRLRSRNLAASLPLMPAEDFPAWPASAEPETHAVTAGPMLGRALDSSAEATGAETLPMVHSVRFEVAPESLRLVATDRYRLYVTNLPWSEPAESDYRAALHIPANAAKTLATMVKPAERVVLGFPGPDGTGANSLHVGIPHRTLLTRLSNVDYPRYEQFLDRQPGRTFTVDRAELTGLVKRVATLAAVNGEDKSRHVRAAVGGGGLTLTAMGVDEASLSDAIDAEHGPEWDTEPWEFAANAAFLGEAAAHIPAKRVTVSMSHPAKPFHLDPADTPDYPARVVLMPVRLPK